MTGREKLIIMFRGPVDDLVTKQQMEAGYTLGIAIPPHFTEGMLILRCPDNDKIIIDGTEAMEREVQFQIFTKDRKYQTDKKRRTGYHQ